MVESTKRLREVLAEAGGVTGAWRTSVTGGPPVQAPFGSAVSVESDDVVAVPVPGGAGEARDAAFADGIQRFVVEGWIGLTPVLRAYVAAAVLLRRDRALSPIHHVAEEFIVVPMGRLPDTTIEGLRGTGLPVRDCGPSEREHPVLDIQLAVREIERARMRAEGRVAMDFRHSYPDDWLVVDGSLRAFPPAVRESRTLGVIKSHETQYFAGVDLETALTLAEGHRTTVFRRVGPSEDTLYSWYLRLWDWTGHDILYGLVRLERQQAPHVIEEADEVCRWLMTERTPIAAPDGRWDRLLYPIREVENYLRAISKLTLSSTCSM